MTLAFGGTDRSIDGRAVFGARERRRGSRIWALGERILSAPATRPAPTTEQEERVFGAAFARIADILGLTPAERSTLFAADGGLSRAILALEVVGAALELFASPAPAAAAAWLRNANEDEPFNCRSPLSLMAADGRLGVEITLLHLRARLRCARAC